MLLLCLSHFLCLFSVCLFVLDSLPLITLSIHSISFLPSLLYCFPHVFCHSPSVYSFPHSFHWPSHRLLISSAGRNITQIAKCGSCSPLEGWRTVGTWLRNSCKSTRTCKWWRPTLMICLGEHPSWSSSRLAIGRRIQVIVVVGLSM